MVIWTTLVQLLEPAYNHFKISQYCILTFQENTLKLRTILRTMDASMPCCLYSIASSSTTSASMSALAVDESHYPLPSPWMCPKDILKMSTAGGPIICTTILCFENVQYFDINILVFKSSSINCFWSFWVVGYYNYNRITLPYNSWSILGDIDERALGIDHLSYYIII